MTPQMKSVTRRLLTGLVAVSVFAGLSSRGLAADPTGEQVMDKFIEATGGKAAYDKVKSRVITGTIEIMPQGIKGDIKTISKSPNQSRTTINFAGLGMFESGMNNGIAWEKNPITGSRVLEGEEKERAMREADVAASADWKKYYEKVENKGIKEINGKPAYQLELTPKKGQPTTQYFDVDSGLLVQMEMHVSRPEGEFDMVSNPTDWKDFGGIKVATKTTNNIKNAGQQQVLTLANVEVNSDIPASTFDIPEDVKAMATGGSGATTKPSK